MTAGTRRSLPPLVVQPPRLQTLLPELREQEVDVQAGLGGRLEEGAAACVVVAAAAAAGAGARGEALREAVAFGPGYLALLIAGQ